MEISKNNNGANASWTLTSAGAFSIMMVLIWTRSTVFAYVVQVIKMLPYIGHLGSYIYPTVITLLTIVALPWFAKRIQVSQILFYLVGLLVVLGTMVVFPANAAEINKSLGRILVDSLPMIFVGAAYEHEKHKKLLFWASLLGTLTMFSYQIYQLVLGRELYADSMDAAYKSLPGIMYLIYYAFSKNKLRYWLVAALGMASAFIYGTRGPVLCVLLLLVVGILLQLRHAKTAMGRFFIIVVIAALLLFVFSGDAMVTVAQNLSRQFAKWGFSTRIFDYFIAGELTDSSGRDRLLEKGFAVIEQNPIFGIGLLGDQARIGQYMHNLFVELWVEFGVIFGSGLILYFITLPTMAVLRQKGNRDYQLFLYMLICLNVKLMLSSTYTVEPYFFFLLGVCMTAMQRRERPSPRVCEQGGALC